MRTILSVWKDSNEDNNSESASNLDGISQPPPAAQQAFHRLKIKSESNTSIITHNNNNNDAEVGETNNNGVTKEEALALKRCHELTEGISHNLPSLQFDENAKALFARVDMSAMS